MQVHQNMSILFYRKRKKINKKTGYIPIYCRMTIDGLNDEISTGCTILNEDWDTENKTVQASDPNHKTINKKLGQIKTDLERHFDLVVAKHGLATPEQVFASYKTPINGHKQQIERKENAAYSLVLDELIKDVVKHLRKIETLEKRDAIAPSQLEILKEEKQQLIQRTDKLGIRGRKIWDNRDWEKSLVVAIDEYLFHFLELVLAGERARVTFSKLITTKARLAEFTLKRYKKEDLLLNQVEESFIKDFVKHITIYHQNSHNTVWKYVQIVKEIIERAFFKGWIATNVFGLFTWGYIEPEDKEWPTMEEMLHLIQFDFGKKKHLSELRYVFVFQAFSGLSYAELYNLKPEHLKTGIDGKTWIDQRRQKTEVQETLPLLPICLEILEMFKNDPRCLRKGKCLPVPTDQHYNRNLKDIGFETDIYCLNNSHQARYFFSNEVAHDNGVHIDEIGILLGQKDGRSVRTYVKPKKKKISENMQMVEEKLYKGGGPTIKKEKKENGGAKIIQIGKAGIHP